VLALAIIGGSLMMNPMPANAQTSFTVMLTDPPTVPEGTSKLMVSYSDIQLHVKYLDGTTNWVASQDDGTVDLLTLVGISQTITELSLPTGSSVDKLKFTISSANATINGVTYPVTIVSETLIVNLKGVTLNGINAGALIDLRPKLLEINALDDEGEPVSYYVLVPSALGVDKRNVGEEHRKIGNRRHLDDNEENELEEELQNANKNIAVAAQIKVVGDTTTLKVTFTNNGEKTVIINGLEVHGEYKFSQTAAGNKRNDQHPRSIVFRVTDNGIIPHISGEQMSRQIKGLELEPGESETLTFTGVIQMKHDHGKAPIIITPIVGSDYEVRVSGEGSQAIIVTASTSFN
jgi:hypothetical protein